MTDKTQADLRAALEELNDRLLACLPFPMTVSDAYDSFYQALVAEALAAPIPPQEVAGLRSSDAELRRMLDVMNQGDVSRWEVGFRNIVSILLGPRTDFEIADIVERVRALAAPTVAAAQPAAAVQATEALIRQLSSALNGMLTFFGMDEDESSKATFDAARQAHEFARITTRPLEPHERAALTHLRATLHGWHERAVALGADGIDDVLHAAEVAKRRGELRAVDGFIAEWKFPPTTPQPTGEPQAQPEPACDPELMGVIASLGAALRKLSFAAQTTGGTAGPDAGLQEAIAGAEQALSLAGIAQAAAPHAAPMGEYHAWCGSIADEAMLRTSASVMDNVLTDIGDWEDKALAEAVEEVKRDLLALADVIALAAPPTQAEAQVDALSGFNDDDLDGVACCLESEPATINVGNVTGEGDEHIESGAAYGARFIRAYLAARAKDKTQ